MLNHEWSLVFFTILSQLSVGMILALTIFSFFKQFHKEYPKNSLAKKILYTAVFVMFIALILSFFHLNQPFRSVYALSNIKTSWLSREILTASVFLAFSALTMVVFIVKRRSQLIQTFLTVTSVAGVLFIYSMSRIYMIPTVPPWSTPETITSFFSAALLLGFIPVLACYSENYKTSLHQLVTDKYSVILIIIILLALSIKVINTLFLDSGITYHDAGLPPQQLPLVFQVMRWSLLLIGTVFFAAEIVGKVKGKPGLIAWIVFGCFLISETIDRIMFYASYFRIGL